jgi:hypothetical protein
MWHILTTIGSLLFGNFGPKVFEYFQRRQDNAQELEVLKLQIEAQKQVGQQRLEAIEATGETLAFLAALNAQAKPTGIRWVDAWGGAIRPGVTTLVVLAYVGIKLHLLLTGNEPWSKAWAEEDFYFLEVVVGFWFGDRSHFKKRK